MGFLSQLECVVDRDDPDLLSLRPDEPDFRRTDALVDTCFGADVTSLSLISAAGAAGGACGRPGRGILWGAEVRTPRHEKTPRAMRSAGQPRQRRHPHSGVRRA